MKRTVTFMLLMVGIAVPLWLIAGRAGRAKKAEAAAAETADDGEGSSATTARGSAARPPQVLVVPVPQGPTQPAAPAEPAAKAPEQVAAEFEEAFRTDKPATANSVKMESNISSGFQSARAKGAALQKVDCHDTRCRLSVDFDDDAADRRVVGNIFELLADAGVDTAQLGFIIPTRATGPNGKVSAVIHLYRVSAEN